MKKILFYIILICIYTKVSYTQWVELSSGINSTIFSISAVNNDVVWGGSFGPNIIRTVNGGSTWTNVGVTLPPPYGAETCIFALDSNTAFFATYSGNPTSTYVYKTSNAGQNWQLVFTQSPGNISAIWMKTSVQGFMVGWPKGGRWSLWRTSNGGNYWDSTGMYIPETNPSVLSFDNSLYYSSPYIWFGARGKGVYYSTNNGNSWTLQDLTGGGNPYPSALWFENQTTGYSSAQLNVIKSTNSGNNWSPLPGSTGTSVIKGIVGLYNEIWYVRDLDSNIYYSSDNGNNWTVQHSSPSGTGYKHITKSRYGNSLWACTISGEIEKNILPAVVTPINGVIPSSYKLYQNYPNPFNPSTKIRFNIPSNVKGETSNVNMTLFDILGKKVEILVNQDLKPGSYEVSWDATGKPSGVYFYKMSTGNFSETKKLILLK